MRRYRAEGADLEVLQRDVDRTIQEFDAARDVLRRERLTLESDVLRGGCPFDRWTIFYRAERVELAENLYYGGCSPGDLERV